MKQFPALLIQLAIVTCFACSPLQLFAQYWNTTGNALTTSANFIGTSDWRPILFGLNSINAGFVDSSHLNTALGFQSQQGYIATMPAVTIPPTISGNTSLGFYSLLGNLNGNLNTAIGLNTMLINMNGNSNVAVGANALYNTLSDSNVAIGYNALYQNQGGVYNTACGTKALENSFSGSVNTALGYKALANITGGGSNTAVGAFALAASGGGITGNTAVGAHALLVSRGNANTAVGDGSLSANSGYDNTGIGQASLTSNTNGNSNTAVGKSAMGGNSTGNENAALGEGALTANSTGSGNIGIGYNSGSITTGDYNTSVGYQGLTNISTGLYNTALGAYAGANKNYNNSTSLGANAVAPGSDEIMLGDASVTWVGSMAGAFITSDARVKEDIKYDVPGLSFIKLLRPVSYSLNIHKVNEITCAPQTADYPTKYDIEKMKMVGFLAQDVEAAANKIGFKFSGVRPASDEHSLYSIRYTDIIMPLVKAVQEQQKEIEDLRTENQMLKSNQEKLNALTAEVTNLIKEMSKAKVASK